MLKLKFDVNANFEILENLVKKPYFLGDHNTVPDWQKSTPATRRIPTNLHEANPDMCV